MDVAYGGQTILKKKRCSRLTQRQRELQEIEVSLEHLQRLGFLGETRIVDGEKQYHVGPQQVAIMREILSHPEKWPDHWNDERRAQWYGLREEAIKKGMIEP